MLGVLVVGGVLLALPFPTLCFPWPSPSAALFGALPGGHMASAARTQGAQPGFGTQVKAADFPSLTHSPLHGLLLEDALSLWGLQ